MGSKCTACFLGQPAPTDKLTRKPLGFLRLSAVPHALAASSRQYKRAANRQADWPASPGFRIKKRRDPSAPCAWDPKDIPRGQCRCLHIKEETQTWGDRVLWGHFAVPCYPQVWLPVPRFCDLLEEDPILSDLYSFTFLALSLLPPHSPDLTLTSTILTSQLLQSQFYLPSWKSFFLLCWSSFVESQ